jgi:hypothetical protein
MSTLGHLTNGAGLSIVTGYLSSAAKGNGLDNQAAHDTRYEVGMNT